MNNKKLTILGLIAVIMIFWAVMQSRIANRPMSIKIGPSYLIQGLNPDAVAQISIKSKNDSVQLNRVGSNFVVTNKDNYPAKSERINELFTLLMGIKTDELVTSSPLNHEELEVTEEKADVFAKLMDEKNQLILGVILGKQDERGSSYIRLINSNDVYLSSTNVPWIRSSPKDYLDLNLIKVDTQDIASITITDSNGLSYTLQSDPNTSDIVLAGGMPAGKKFKSDAKTIFAVLSNLNFESVKKENPSDNLIFNKTCIGKLKDSTVYIIKLAQDSNDVTFIQCSADYPDKEDVVIDVNKKESDEELRKKEAKLLAMDAVDRLNRKCKGWNYEVSPWVAGNLTMPLNELFEDINNSESAEETEE